jgi:chorismate-pyruvate lyase
MHSSAWTSLLDRFYSQTGYAPPRLERLEGDRLPEPYRKLLVHSSDMTPALESFHESQLRIQVLGRDRDGENYFREVLLLTEPGLRPVEYGVIRICLDHLPARARDWVLGENRPLGDILRAEAIPHLSWPQSFFRLSANERLCGVFGLVDPPPLYGRRNVLLSGSRRLIAEVFEVLPPAEQANHS